MSALEKHQNSLILFPRSFTLLYFFLVSTWDILKIRNSKKFFLYFNCLTFDWKDKKNQLQTDDRLQSKMWENVMKPTVRI